MADLTAKHYHIFNQVSGKAPFDLVAYRDGELRRVSVKSCNKDPRKDGGFVIEVGRVRANKTENKIYKFDQSECDLLAIYIVKEDRIVYVESTVAHDKRQIIIQGRSQLTEVHDLENH